MVGTYESLRKRDAWDMGSWLLLAFLVFATLGVSISNHVQLNDLNGNSTTSTTSAAVSALSSGHAGYATDKQIVVPANMHIGVGTASMYWNMENVTVLDMENPRQVKNLRGPGDMGGGSGSSCNCNGCPVGTCRCSICVSNQGSTQTMCLSCSRTGSGGGGRGGMAMGIA